MSDKSKTTAFTALCSNPLLEVPTIELMKLWAELTECWHGINGYGGHTAEIYAYRLQGYSPMAHTQGNEARLRGQAYKAADALAALCEEFEREHECKITINELSIGEWWAGSRDWPFDHRAHVRVFHQSPQ